MVASVTPAPLTSKPVRQAARASITDEPFPHWSPADAVPGLHPHRSNDLPALALLLGRLLEPISRIRRYQSGSSSATRAGRLACALPCGHPRGCANVRFPFSMGFLGELSVL